MDIIIQKTAWYYVKTFFSEICFLLISLYYVGESIWRIFMIQSSTSFADYGFLIFSLAATIALSVQFFWRNRILGIALSMFFSSVCCYMILAVYSDFQELPIGDTSGLKQLLVGFVLFGSLAILALVMPWKYIKN